MPCLRGNDDHRSSSGEKLLRGTPDIHAVVEGTNITMAVPVVPTSGVVVNLDVLLQALYYVDA